MNTYRLNRIFAMFASIAISSFGCTSSEIDAPACDISVDTTSTPVGSKTPTPMEIPSTAKMSTVIGPLVHQASKWGPDPDLPFSWPGRVVQRDATNPSNPDELLIYEVRLPEGSTLYKVHVWVEPAKGHTQVPFNRATAVVWVHNGGMVESNAVGSAMVTMGDTVLNYEQRFLLTEELSPPLTIAADERVFVYVFGEWGAGSMPGLIVDTPEIVFSE